MSKFFSAQPGFSGYFGPAYGQQAIIKFGRMSTANSTLSELKDSSFLCDRYTISWSRPVSIKHFLNTTKPAAIAGYGNGTLTINGLFGTYAGFQMLTGTDANEDVCNPLVALIQGSNGFISCNDKHQSVRGATTIAWQCYNLVVQSVTATAQVQENGTMFQQGDVVFQIGGLVPKSSPSNSAGATPPVLPSLK